VRLLASNKEIWLEVSVEPGLAPLRADPGRVKQVLWNLLSNAIKFTPQGGRIDVDVKARSAAPGDAYAVSFAVTDTGIGIPPEDVEHVFDEFYQVDGSSSKNHIGTGLGLALARKFVKLHGGAIEVESVVGSGSRFVFWVPSAAEEPSTGTPVEAMEEADVAASRSQQ
jgi:signal transduction histidine kinase